MRKIKKPPCPFGQVLLDSIREKGLNAYDIQRKYSISAMAIYRFIDCVRFPTPFKDGRGVKITELAKILGLSKRKKVMFYKSLLETFYNGLVGYLKDINETKLTDEYIKSLVDKKPRGKSWTEIYTKIPEPTVRKIRNLRADISLLNTRDVLKEYLNVLNINDKQKAEILYYFLKKKGAEEEFLNLIKEG